MGADDVAKYKQIFQKFDSKNDGYITYQQMCDIGDPPKKMRKYYDYILINYFKCGKEQNNLSFQNFVILCKEADDILQNQNKLTSVTFTSQPLMNDNNGDQKPHRRSKSSKLQSKTLPVPRNSDLPAGFEQEQQNSKNAQYSSAHYNSLMQPASEKEINDVRTLVERMLDNTQDVQTKDQMSLNEMFGLKVRNSLDLVVRMDTLDQKKNKKLKDYITEQEICILLDYISQQKINYSSLLSQQTIKDNYETLQNDNQQSEIAKLLIKEYDITRSGSLSDIEYNNLMAVIKKEIMAHKTFLGSNIKNVGDYMIGRTLGFGKTSVCKVATYLGDLDKQVALKICQKTEQSDGLKQLLQLGGNYCKYKSEYEILKKVKHENLVELLDYFQHIDENQQEWTVMALTLCGGGSLSEYRSSTVITESIARYFFYYIVVGLQALHDQKIVHLDLRLENVLIDNQANIKICDFGNSLSFENVEDLPNLKAGTIAGTLSYMPPEMLEGEIDFQAQKVDMWMLGLLLYELLTGKKAFPVKPGQNNEEQVVVYILNAKYEPLALEFSPEARELVNDLMNYDPTERPTIEQVMNSKWLNLVIHKPAIAKGLVLLDPAPDNNELKQRLQQCLTQENITYFVLKSTKEQIFRWQCTYCNGLLFNVTAEYIEGNAEEINHMELAYQAVQTQEGQKQIENIALQNFKQSDTAIKLTFFMRNGILWEFQKIYRRIRYQIINAFIGSTHNLEEAENNRIDSHPAVELVITRNQSRVDLSNFDMNKEPSTKPSQNLLTHEISTGNDIIIVNNSSSHNFEMLASGQFDKVKLQ